MPTNLATIRHLFIYPVKSMRGLPVTEAHLGLNGILGDRRYAFVRRELAGANAFPWMTGRTKPRMILYTPRFAHAPTPADADPPIVVTTPDGDEFDVGDARLRERLEADARCDLFLLKTGRGNYDSQHLSLFNLLSLRQLEMESGEPIDLRQFRANIYLDPSDSMPFTEDGWLGHIVQIGGAVVGVTKKDTRCMMITLDPQSAAPHPNVLRAVVRQHNEQAGIYANVIAPGVVRVGDTMRVIARAGVTNASYED